MILEPQHLHRQQPTKNQRKKPRHNQFNADEQIRNIFEESLTKSEGRLNELTVSTLNRLRELRQKRIYTSFNDSPLEYLFIAFQDRRSKMALESQKLEHLVQKKKRIVSRDLLQQRLSIEKRPKSINQIKKQLDQSINQVKINSPRGSISSQGFENYDTYKPQNYYEFRKKSYWKIPNEKTEEVQKFIKNMRQKQHSQHKRYRQKRKKQKQLQKSVQESKEAKKVDENQKLRQQLHKQFHKKKEQKDKYDEQNKKKMQQVSQFLKKFKEKPPNYIIFSDRYRKKQSQEEKQKREFLKQLREAKRHSSLTQIRQQMRRYDQMKEAHQAERSQERKMQGEVQEQIRQQLNKLYRSKVFTKSLAQKSPLDLKAEKQKQMMKMIMYSKKAQMEHSPKIDEEKRSQFQKEIQQLKKRQDHERIVKKRNGEQIIINRSKLNPRRLGLEYLEEVKQITSLVERKPPPTPPVKEQKIIDRSLLKNSFYNKKITISNWKQILENKNLTQQEKQQKLEVFFEMVEQKKKHNTNEMKNSDRDRALELQKIIDHYEIEKTAAKLAMLKSMK